MLSIKTKKIGLVVLAIASAVGTVVAACKATLEARDILADKALTKRQKALRIALAYVLAVCTAIVGGLSVKGLIDIKNDEITALDTLSLERLDTIKMYRAHVDKEVKDEKRIWEVSNIHRLTGGRCPFTIDQVDYTTGDMIFYDQLHKTWYVRNRDIVLNAEKSIIDEVKSGKFKEGVPVNRYYDKVGLPHTDFGKFLGWGVYDEESNGLFDYVISKRDKDGLIFTVILYKLKPYKFNTKEGESGK